MTENYICPCCSYKGVFTDNLAKQVLTEVCNHYHTYFDAAMVKSKDRTDCKVRAVFCYIIMKLTGASPKEISAYFGYADVYKATQYRMVCINKMCLDEKFYEEVESLIRKIIMKINLAEKKKAVI